METIAWICKLNLIVVMVLIYKWVIVGIYKDLKEGMEKGE